MIHIRVTKGPDKGEQIKTRQGVVSVGRSHDARPVLDALGKNMIGVPVVCKEDAESGRDDLRARVEQLLGKPKE